MRWFLIIEIIKIQARCVFISEYREFVIWTVFVWGNFKMGLLLVVEVSLLRFLSPYLIG